jgi:hypothetical protein
MEGIYDRVTLFEMWLKVAFKFNAEASVLIEFVRFLKQRHWRSVAGFSFLEVRRCFALVFQFLSDHDGGSSKLSLFADLVGMEHQAGYKERAVAMIQALIEYNSVPGAHVMDFVVFWRTNKPRVGDPNYAGSPCQSDFFCLFV